MFSKSNDKKGAETSAPAKTGAKPVAAQDRPATAPAASPRAAAPSAPRAPSMISADMVIEGAIRGEGDLIVEGQVKGSIAVTRVTIGRKGLVEGSIQAEHADVHGRVAGDVEALSVKLHGSARVEGDITHCDLAVDSGAFFEGRSIQKARQDAAQVIELKPAPREPASEA